MHHTRKNRSLKKKTKALKKSRSKRSLKNQSKALKKKSNKSRKVNKRRIRGGDGKYGFEEMTKVIQGRLNDYNQTIENADSTNAKNIIVGITNTYLNNDKHDDGCTGQLSFSSIKRQAYKECHAGKYTIYKDRADLGQYILYSWSNDWILNPTENTTKTNLEKLIQTWLTLAKKKDPDTAAAAEDAEDAKKAAAEAKKAEEAAAEEAAAEAQRIEYKRIIDMGENPFFYQIPREEVEVEVDYTDEQP